MSCCFLVYSLVFGVFVFVPGAVVKTFPGTIRKERFDLPRMWLHFYLTATRTANMLSCQVEMIKVNQLAHSRPFTLIVGVNWFWWVQGAEISLYPCCPLVKKIWFLSVVLNFSGVELLCKAAWAHRRPLGSCFILPHGIDSWFLELQVCFLQLHPPAPTPRPTLHRSLKHVSASISAPLPDTQGLTWLFLGKSGSIQFMPLLHRKHSFSCSLSVFLCPS